MLNHIAVVGLVDFPQKQQLIRLLTEMGYTCSEHATLRDFQDAHPDVPPEQVVYLSNEAAPDEQDRFRHGTHMLCSKNDGSYNFAADAPPGSFVAPNEIEERFTTLTPRELETLKLIAQGRSSKQIAYELGIAPRTVANHRASIRAKTGYSSIAQLVGAYLKSTQK